MGRLGAADAASVDAHRGVKRGMAGGRVVSWSWGRETWGFGLSSLPRFDVPSAKAVLVPIW
jgi:hypothetical protein